jgi:hypothetical protein
MGKLRRFEETVAVLVGAENAGEELVASDAGRWGPLLAAVLEPLAGAFGETGRWDDALAASRRAVELRRSAGSRHDLAVALRVFAHVRAAAGRELPQALEAVSEALQLHLAVLRDERPDRAEYQGQIAMTQQVQELVVRRM